MQSFDTFWVGGQSGFVLISPGGEQPIAPPIPPTFEPPVIDADEIYNDCVTNKVCFGYPIGCIGTRDCHIFGAVIHEDDSFIFELLSERKISKFLFLIRNQNMSHFKPALPTLRWPCLMTTEWDETRLSSA